LPKIFTPASVYYGTAGRREDFWQMRLLLSDRKPLSQFIQAFDRMNTRNLITSALSFAILAFCITVVAWQTWQCFAKYLSQPKATDLSVEKLADQPILPTITICPGFYYPVLECGYEE